MIDFSTYIVRDPNISGGQPVFKGTRVTLRTVLASLADGDEEADILHDFPTLTREHVRAAIAFAAAAAIDDMPYAGDAEGLMKVKLDENLPASIAYILADFGHDVDTSTQEGLAGHPDEEIWRAAIAAGRFLVTQDLDFSDVRRLRPGESPGVLLLRLEQPTRRALLRRMRQILDTEDIEDWKGCLVVASDHRIRVRRS